MSNNIIDIKNLKVSFKRKGNHPLEIIRGIDIHVPEGDIVGIVGETHSGKTVLAKSLLDLNDNSIINFESYSVEGNEITNNKKDKLKRLRGKYISYISKSSLTSMNPTRKIGNQLLDVVNKYRRQEFGKSIQKASDNQIIDKRSSKKQKYDFLTDLLKTLQIIDAENIFKLYPHELSTDLKQRISIAIALIAGSKLIILDDITAQMDATTQSSILQLVKKVNSEFKTSFLLITSNIWIVAKMCKYIYVLYAGKIVEKALKHEMFTDPKHPYTWALIASSPKVNNVDSEQYVIPGNIPDMNNLLPGDPFAPRNQFAVEIDFIHEPPLFEVSSTHWAATWMLHPSYPSFNMPIEVLRIVEEFRNSNEYKIIDRVENDAQDIADKITEATYVDEMFKSEPKVHFDVSDNDETESTNEETTNDSIEIVKPVVFEETAITDNEINKTEDKIESNEISEEERKIILQRQARMHKNIKMKLAKHKNNNIQ